MKKTGLFLMLILTVAQSGCVTTGSNMVYSGPGKVLEWSYHPWSAGFTYTTDNYTVRTNTSPETAEYIAVLMERAGNGYREIIGYQEGDLSPFLVNAYATRKEYETVARKYGFPANATGGLYTPQPPAAIHLPYIRGEERHPSSTLVHEGTHQFLDQTMRFEVPSAAKDVLPPSQQKLVSVPLWLNEGLAAYMESSVVEEDQIEVGRINRARLRHLQKLIRKGKCPSVREVLSKRYGEPFSAADYAVSWGIVYTLNEDPDGQKRFQRYLKAARQGFYSDPDREFMRDFLPDGKPVKSFELKWYTHSAGQSPVFFEQIIAGEGLTLEEWEETWTERILRLRS